MDHQWSTDQQLATAVVENGKVGLEKRKTTEFYTIGRPFLKGQVSFRGLGCVATTGVY